MNSSANFTHGPWEAKNFYVFAGAACIAICDTDNASAERYKANARLIAAAPELLAALKGAEEAIANAIQIIHPDCKGERTTLIAAVMDWVKLSRAVIAKATGSE